jgi:hypothetical protein
MAVLFNAMMLSMSSASNPDIHFASVKLLALNDNAPNGTTTFLDQAVPAHTITRVADAIYTSAQKPTGMSSSGLFDGTGDYLSVSNSAGLDLSGDFTIEAFVRLGTTVGNHHLIGKYASNPTGPFAIYQNTSNIRFYAASVTTSWNLINGLLFGTFATDVWYHIEVTRSGDVYRTFKDGVLANSLTVAGTLLVNTGAVTIGSNNAGGEGFNGWMASWRITKGIARHTANFTPPALPLPTF